MEEKSLGGGVYFLTFIDDKSRYTWCYVLKNKSDAFNKFIEWQKLEARSSAQKLKTLRSYNGGEYISKEFENYFKREGIHREFTINKTPEQNGVAELMNRTVQETTCSMLSESGLPKIFWDEALSTEKYI